MQFDESGVYHNANVDEENTRKPEVMPVSQDHQHFPTSGSLSSQEDHFPLDITENLHASHYETQGAENNQYTSLIVSQQTPCEGYQKLVSQPSSST